MNLLNLDEQRKNDLLNSALTEFISKGYDRASTNVIAKEARISKALMFHYIGSKKELFLSVYDYFNNLLKKEYLMKINFSNQDIFDRLDQSFRLQIDLIKQYPAILEFSTLSNLTNSTEINDELRHRVDGKLSSCDQQIFEHIDESKFRTGLDIETCKKLILWSTIGFTDQILNDLKHMDDSVINDEDLVSTLNGYINELRKVFYQ